ncbi:MAG: hypothetical protein H0X43_11325 [Nitrosospira sp.]|nr:hypothetical protein [Nitrosospira sp.]
MRCYSTRFPLAILLCAVLAGCAGLPTPKHPENRNIASDEKIATDTVNQLARLYPPAKTQFNLIIIEPRDFGTILASRLRAKGYAVAETIKKSPRSPLEAFGAFGASFQPNPGNRAEQETERKTEASSASGTGFGTELRYTLDDSHADSLLRISLNVGDATLARAYLADNGDVAAAGAWTFRGQ